MKRKINSYEDVPSKAFCVVTITESTLDPAQTGGNPQAGRHTDVMNVGVPAGALQTVTECRDATKTHRNIVIRVLRHKSKLPKNLVSDLEDAVEGMGITIDKLETFWEQ